LIEGIDQHSTADVFDAHDPNSVQEKQVIGMTILNLGVKG